MSKKCTLMCGAGRHIRRFREPYLDAERKIRNTAEVRLLAVVIYFKAMQLTNKSKTVRDFHPSVRTLADHFGASTKTVRAALLLLVKSGWFTLAQRGGFHKESDGSRVVFHNPKSGRLLSTAYIPVEHKKWAKNHEGECEKLDSPVSAKGDTGPVLIKTAAGRVVAKTIIQSSNLESSNSESSTEATACKTCKPPVARYSLPSKSESKATPLAAARRSEPSQERTAEPFGEGKDETHYWGKPDDWVPLEEMRQMIYEFTGVKPYFPKPVILELRPLAKKYGSHTLLDAVALSLKTVGDSPTFDWKKFATWFLIEADNFSHICVSERKRGRSLTEQWRGEWAN